VTSAPEDPALATAVREVLAAHAATIAEWRRGVPGTWGVLAGQSVLAYRRHLGRKLTDPERRRAWAAMWAALQARE
jgi:hypothetical protein